MTLPSIDASAKTVLLTRIFHLLLLLTLLLIPIALIPVHTLNPAIHSKEYLARSLVAGLISVFALRTWAAGIRKIELAQVAMLALIVANVLSCLFSGRIRFSLYESWYLWGYTALAIAIVQLSPTATHFRKMVFIIILAGLITATYGLSVYFGWDPLRAWYPFAFREEEGRNFIHSFLGNPEYFGGYMSPLAVLSFGMSFRQGIRVTTRLIWMLLVVVFLLALLLSGTRGALLGFAVGAGVIMLNEVPRLGRIARRKVYVLLTLMALAAATVLVVFSFPNRLNTRNLRLAQRFEDLLDINSASIRERIFFFSVSSSIIADNPLLGSGPGTYKTEFYRGVEHLNQRDDRAGVMRMTADLHSRVAEHAHNDYLEFWCELGTFGIASLLFIMSLLALRFVCTPAASLPWKDSPGISHLPKVQLLTLLRTAFFASALCIFVNAAFSFPLHLPVRALLAWVLIGSFFSVDQALRQIPVARKDAPEAS